MGNFMNTPRNQPQPSRIKPLATAIAACLVLNSFAVQAATIRVNSLSDELNFGNGECTLREAVVSANGAGIGVSDCIEGSVGEDTIEFDVEGTITLGFQIGILEALIIDASAHPPGSITIDGGAPATGPAFRRVLGARKALKLNNLIITNGRTTGASGETAGSRNCIESIDYTAGGAICTEDVLELIDTTISNSKTEGSFAFGGGFSADSVMLTNSSVIGNSTEGNNARGGGFRATHDVKLIDSVISGNSTSGLVASGGGFFANGKVSLSNSVVIDNRTSGEIARGGGFFVGDGNSGGSVISVANNNLTNSTVSGNFTEGDEARGGGFYTEKEITLISSTISGNSTMGGGADGGGFGAEGVVATNSVVSNNSTGGANAHGGGFFTSELAFFTNSMVSGNHTEGENSQGGGVYAKGEIGLIQSTVSGNNTTGPFSNGGGFFMSNLDQPAFFLNSTISDNVATEDSSVGDGIFLQANAATNVIVLGSTILSGNGTDNFSASNTATLDLSAINSLFGDADTEINSTNTDNQFSNTPNLAPLADNDCAIPAGAAGTAACVSTHALLATSIAIDKGAADASILFDQRGTGFPRIVGIQADIGAFEAPLIALGDCNISGGIDASDVSCTIDVILETGTGNADCTDDSLVNTQDVVCTIDKAQ